MEAKTQKKTFDPQDFVLGKKINEWRTSPTPESARMIRDYLVKTYPEKDGFNPLSLLRTHNSGLNQAEMGLYKENLRSATLPKQAIQVN